MTTNNANYILSAVKRARSGGRRRRRPRSSESLFRIRTTTHQHHVLARSRRKNLNHLARKSKLAAKLEALKKLIPLPDDGEILKADRLFQETANYIVLLRTRALILQKLIEFYGANENDVAVAAVL